MRIRHLIAAAALAVGTLVVPTGIAAAETGFFAAAAAEESAEGEHKFANHEAELCFELLEQGRTVEDCQKSPNPILPAKNELIWGGIAFFVVFFLIWKFGYPAIKKGLEDRTNRIRESIDEGDRAKAEGQAVLADYQRQLADAKGEANRIIDEARQAADGVRADLIARAEAEVAELRQRGRDDVDAGKARAIADLQAQVGDLTIELAEKIVGRSIDAETNRALIDNYIADLGSRN